MRSTQAWTEATLEATRDLSPTIREFLLRPDDGAADWEPGSHLQVQLLVGGRPQTRTYSLVGQPGGGLWRIAVKRLDAGQGGSLAMWRLSTGDRLRVCGPHNHFPLDLTAPAYLLVAGGIGITPLAGMAQLLAERGANLRLLYGARSVDELALVDELAPVLGTALQTHVPERGGRIDLPAAIAALPEGGQMYVCGPVPMLDEARRAWREAGRPAARLRYETFGSSGRHAPQPFRVQIPRQRLDITVPADCSLLDALDQAGVMTISDCRRGECGLCAMDVIGVDGEIDHRDVFLSDHEKASGRRICACVSRVVGSVVLDSAYRPDR
jgi:vanillate O-demethylase ferredoxin subunit